MAQVNEWDCQSSKLTPDRRVENELQVTIFRLRMATSWLYFSTADTTNSWFLNQIKVSNQFHAPASSIQVTQCIQRTELSQLFA
jgi:hypothetical protein